MSSPEDHMKELGIDPSDFNMSGSQISSQEKEKAQKILDACIKNPDNRHCADCNALGPRWASMNLGIFVCLNCSGIHRRLGVHISKVKSVTLDGWKIKWAEWMKSRGNKISNAYFEGNTNTRHYKKPNENTSSLELEEFIRAKYERKEWIAVGGPKGASTSVQPAGEEKKKQQEAEDFKLAQKLQNELNLSSGAQSQPSQQSKPAPAPAPAAVPKAQPDPFSSGGDPFGNFGGSDPFASNGATGGGANDFGAFGSSQPSTNSDFGNFDFGASQDAHPKKSKDDILALYGNSQSSNVNNPYAGLMAPNAQQGGGFPGQMGHAMPNNAMGGGMGNMGMGGGMGNMGMGGEIFGDRLHSSDILLRYAKFFNLFVQASILYEMLMCSRSSKQIK
eukprot:768521-Hanusia_phi.AAC.1